MGPTRSQSTVRGVRLPQLRWKITSPSSAYTTSLGVKGTPWRRWSTGDPGAADERGGRPCVHVHREDGTSPVVRVVVMAVVRRAHRDDRLSGSGGRVAIWREWKPPQEMPTCPLPWSSRRTAGKGERRPPGRPKGAWSPSGGLPAAGCGACLRPGRRLLPASERAEAPTGKATGKATGRATGGATGRATGKVMGKSIDIRSYQVIKNIPVVIRYRPWWTGGWHG